MAASQIVNMVTTQLEIGAICLFDGCEKIVLGKDSTLTKAPNCLAIVENQIIASACWVCMTDSGDNNLAHCRECDYVPCDTAYTLSYPSW